MPIQLIQDEERLTYEWEDSSIFYRRISSAKRGFIVKKHTKRGNPDWNAIAKEIMEFIILGWENVCKNKKPVPFSTEIVASLPDEVQSDLLELSGGASPPGIDEETPEKNSGTSSSGK